MNKVFVISGANSHLDKIEKTGKIDKAVESNGMKFYYVDGEGPYNAGFVFAATDENIKAFNKMIEEFKLLNDLKNEAMYGFLRNAKRP